MEPRFGREEASTIRPDDVEFLDTRQVAERYGLSQQQVRRLCRAGNIKGAFKDAARDWKVPDSAVRQYLARPGPWRRLTTWLKRFSSRPAVRLLGIIISIVSFTGVVVGLTVDIPTLFERAFPGPLQSQPTSTLTPPPTASVQPPRTWVDDTSFGLENDRLLLHGSEHAYLYTWWFDYLLFKDTGTVWRNPWGELTLWVGAHGEANTPGAEYTVRALNEDSRASIVWSMTTANMRLDVIYTLYASEPVVHIETQVTNLGAEPVNTDIGVGMHTYIAGDIEHDFYYVPGEGQHPFTGVSRDSEYGPTAQPWIAFWDHQKGEGFGVVGGQGFNPAYVSIYDWSGLCLCPEGGGLTTPEFGLEAGQSSPIHEAYLLLFTGSGSSAVQDFYESLRATVNPTPFPTVPFSPTVGSVLPQPSPSPLPLVDVRELYYDDGVPEQGVIAGPGRMALVRFHVSSTAKLTALKFYVSGNQESARVHVLDGQLSTIYSQLVTPASTPQWLEVDVSDKGLLVGGDFYVGWEWISARMDSPWLWVDTTLPTSGHSLLGSPGDSIVEPAKCDYLIRVILRD